MSVAFRKYGDRTRYTQKFDKDKITITKMGKTYNVYDAIQAANVDTNIYDVMKKYNCQIDEATELMKERGGEQGIYADIVELQEKAQDLGDLIKVKQHADQLFEQLPSEIKIKYGNDLKTFLKEQAEIQKQKTTEQTKETEKKEVANETK